MADSTRRKLKVSDGDNSGIAALINKLKLLNAKMDNMQNEMEKQVNRTLGNLTSESQDFLKKELEKTAKECRQNWSWRWAF